MTDKLVPIEQKEIKFYDDNLTAIKADDGRVYASIRHMCQALGIDVQGQRQRINRHTILKRGLMVCNLHTIRGLREGYVLRADLVPLWLSGIRTKSVNDESRAKLERFQEEAAAVLWEAFQDGRLTADPDFDELLKSDSDAVQAYKMLQALIKLAHNQIVLEARLDRHDDTLADYGARLETIEADLHKKDRYITESQATQISQAVKSIAIAMGKKSGRNEFGATWGEFYRKFGIAKYRYLPVSRFDAAVAWLDEFYQDVTGDAPF
ncbi:MAG: hypothetical protein GY796_22975 [Chloroflexi bacterium]|nr:hypothetical protein [Chloroflexota bacterium]